MSLDSEPRRGSTSITPKTPWVWLDSRNRLFTNHEVIGRVTGDVCINLTEIAPQANLDVVLSVVTCTGRIPGTGVYSGNTLRGRSAFERAIAPTVASVVWRAGWDMHSPEVVCMGAGWFLHQLDLRIANLGGRMEDARRNKHAYPEGEYERVVDKLSKEQYVIKKEKPILEEGLEGYATDVGEEILPVGARRLLPRLPDLGKVNLSDLSREEFIAVVQDGNDKLFESMLISAAQRHPVTQRTFAKPERFYTRGRS